MRTTLWPAGLIGRVGLVLFAAVMLELVGSTFVFEQAELLSSDAAQARRIAEQLDIAARVLTVTSAEERPAVAATLSEPTMTITWSETRGTRTWPESDEQTRSLRAKLIDNEPGLASRNLVLRADPSDPKHIVEGRANLDDGTRLKFRATALGSSLPSLYNQFGSIVVLSICVLFAALILVRTLAQPLRMLVSATDAIGHGPSVHLAEMGPREIRRVAKAFNAMQDRIAKLIRDRTEALAAVSHDLRTPIARMKLRTGFLASTEDQAAFHADLDEMEAMLFDLNAYLGGDTDPEKPRPTDVAAMLQTLTHNATDAGRKAAYDGPDRLTLTVRPLAAKRAFANLVNNAIAYGDGVSIRLVDAGDRATITFEDEGPGIPEAQLASMFEPFVRGDASRNREKGGMGLGLAIARQAVWRHGGTIELANRRQGGLRVTVTLPQGAD